MRYSSKARQAQKCDRETGLKLPAKPKARSKSPAPKAATAIKIGRSESSTGLSKLPRETAAKPPPSPTGLNPASPSGPAETTSPHAFRTLPGYKGEKNVHGLIDCFPDCDRKSYGYGGFRIRRNFIVHLREIHGQDIGSYDRRGGRSKRRQGKRTLRDQMGEGSGFDVFGRGGEDTDGGGLESDWRVLEWPVQFWVDTASFSWDAPVKEHPPPTAEKESTIKPDHIDRDISEMQHEQWTDSEIQFEPYHLTQFDLVGVWLEQKLGKQLDWWPLSPPVYPDKYKSGLTKMSWKCKCGSTLSSVISNEVVGRYQRSHSSQGPAGSGSTTTVTGGPSPTPIQLSTLPLSPADARLGGGARSARKVKKPQKSFSIPAGYNSGGGGSPMSSRLPRLPPSAFLARSGSMASGQRGTAASATTLVGGPGLNLGSYILCCIRKGLYKTVLVQMGGGTFTNDQEFFRNLRAEYRRARGWRQWVSLSAVVQIKFVRFTQYYLNFVDCHESGVLPPATNPDYDYRPKPPHDPPTFPTTEFMHYFDSPACAGTATYCLDLMPKRVSGRLERGARAEGWGLQPTEGLSFWKLVALLLLVWLATLLFAVWWMMVHPGDFQNAFVPATYAASVVAVGVVLPELKVVYVK